MVCGVMWPCVHLVSGQMQGRDKLVKELVEQGKVSKAKDGRKIRYRITQAGKDWLRDN